jgi:hypothetical protein
MQMLSEKMRGIEIAHWRLHCFVERSLGTILCDEMVVRISADSRGIDIFCLTAMMFRWLRFKLELVPRKFELEYGQLHAAQKDRSICAPLCVRALHLRTVYLATFAVS